MANPRSYEKITKADLRRLADLARTDREALFERRPKSSVYRNRLLATALCQGAALHYLDGRNGVKDFDVWSFYAGHPSMPFPYRRRGTADFGESRFGRWPAEERPYLGRRVDLIGRSLPVPLTTDPIQAIKNYLTNSTTTTARLLSEKAVVLVDPDELLGTVVWPV